MYLYMFAFTTIRILNPPSTFNKFTITKHVSVKNKICRYNVTITTVSVNTNKMGSKPYQRTYRELTKMAPGNRAVAKCSKPNH